MMVDPLRRRYVAFLRGGRSRLLSCSEDFVHWTPPEPFLTALHDEESLYNNTGFVYGTRYLGFLTHFDKGPLAQTQTLRLRGSRDGEHWSRLPGPPVVGLGEAGEWDRFQILLTGAPPVRVGDRLHIHYRSTASSRSRRKTPQKLHITARIQAFPVEAPENLAGPRGKNPTEFRPALGLH